MAILTNYQDINEAGLIPVGEYEVTSKKAHFDVTNGGTEYISIPFVIRKDVEQPYRGAHIWHAWYRRKEPSIADKAVDGFSFDQVMRMLKAAGVPNGASFDSMEAVLDAISWKDYRVTVKHEEYNGKINVRVQYVNPSRAGASHAAPPEPLTSPEDDDDGDLPF